MEDDGLTRLAVPVGPDDHVRGPADAAVTMVEYGDFECPFCGTVYPVVKDLERSYPDDLRVVFRHFPLAQHSHAELAAQAAEFAADHGKFWEMHDTLFEHQHALEERQLLSYARDLGVDSPALTTALSEGTYAPVVAEQKEGGEESGIPGTPAFFINDILFEEEPTRGSLGAAIDYVLEHGSVV